MLLLRAGMVAFTDDSMWANPWGFVTFAGIFLVLGPLLTRARRKLALAQVRTARAVLDVSLRWWDLPFALGMGALVVALLIHFMGN